MAGSERVAKSKATQTRLTEAKVINGSLTTLGRVILSLKKGELPPFRESSLSMLLKDSLVGNCRTSLVVTIADEQESISESQATLRFGITAGQINTKVSTQRTVNVEDESNRLKKYLNKIYLELEAMEAEGKNGYLDMNEPKPTRDHFVNNYTKLRQLENAYARAEKHKKDAYVTEINNYKGIVLR